MSSVLKCSWTEMEPSMTSLNLSDYPHIADSDLFKVLRHFPSLDEGGPWIAGGSLWRAFNKEPLVNCDIDVFFKSKKQFEEMSRKMGSLPYVNNVLIETKKKWNTLYKYHVNDGKSFNKTVDIQFINMAHYSSLAKLLNSFDFTVCQFGWDGKHLLVGQTSINDLSKKQIVFWSISKYKSLMKHLHRYLNNGFTISSDQTKVLAYSLGNADCWAKSKSGDYDEDDDCSKKMKEPFNYNSPYVPVDPEVDWEGYGYVNRNAAAEFRPPAIGDCVDAVAQGPAPQPAQPAADARDWVEFGYAARLAEAAAPIPQPADRIEINEVRPRRRNAANRRANNNNLWARMPVNGEWHPVPGGIPADGIGQEVNGNPLPVNNVVDIDQQWAPGRGAAARAAQEAPIVQNAGIPMPNVQRAYADIVAENIDNQQAQAPAAAPFYEPFRVNNAAPAEEVIGANQLRVDAEEAIRRLRNDGRMDRRLGEGNAHYENRMFEAAEGLMQEIEHERNVGIRRNPEQERVNIAHEFDHLFGQAAAPVENRPVAAEPNIAQNLFAENADVNNVVNHNDDDLDEIIRILENGDNNA